VELGVPGAFQVPNALAAATTAAVVGVAEDDIVAGLADAGVLRWQGRLGLAGQEAGTQRRALVTKNRLGESRRCGAKADG